MHTSGLNDPGVRPVDATPTTPVTQPAGMTAVTRPTDATAEATAVAMTDWFLPLTDPAPAAAHVYGLAQAGGGCASLAPLAARLAPDVAMWALNLPGRQARFGEPSRTELAPLVEELTGPAARRTPAVLFGYCSGALLAFLLARRLADRDRADRPAALVVASYPAPDLAAPAPDLHLAGSEEFWGEIISYGGVPAQVADEPDFREIFEEPLRADYALLAGYRYTDEPPLDIPIVVAVGEHDPVLLPEQVDGWRRHTTAGCTIARLPGDHWLLDTAPDALGALLRRLAADGLGGPR